MRNTCQIFFIFILFAHKRCSKKYNFPHTHVKLFWNHIKTESTWKKTAAQKIKKKKNVKHKKQHTIKEDPMNMTTIPSSRKYAVVHTYTVLYQYHRTKSKRKNMFFNYKKRRKKYHLVLRKRSNEKIFKHHSKRARA